MAAGTAGDNREPDTTLEAERGVNERYRRKLESMVDRAPHLAGSVGAARSSSWTDSAPHTTVSRAVVSPIVGRVGFEVVDPALGRGFYIGGLWGQDWDANGQEVLVVAWAAPVAKLFFDGRTATDSSAALVMGRRTFTATPAGDVRAYEDDLEPDCTSGADVFPLPSAGGVVVPPAPRPVVRPPRPRRGPATARAPRPDPSPTTVEPTATLPRPPARPSSAADSAPPSAPTRVTGRGLRAARSVRAAVEAPKTGRLGSVLATLQPDQYGLVTWPDDCPLIVQGQPGTGKTIVATHRAAYLTHRERAPRALDRVAIVGPTEAWRRHVSPSLGQLEASSVTALSLQELPSDLAGVPWHRMTEGRDERADTAWRLGRFVDDAIAADARLSERPATTVRATVDRLSTNDDAALASARERHPDEAWWFTEAGGWSRLSSHTRYLPALAAVGQALRKGGHDSFDHLVVDEAQDVRPLEWKILLRLLRKGGGLTLLGDVNQRRCDWTAPSWADLAVDLEITDEDGAPPVQQVRAGYRSTKRILRFANQLLPSAERHVDALREGVDPVVEKVTATDLDRRAVDAARSLATVHAGGLVAIISMTPRPVSDRLRKLEWSRPADLRDAWSNGDQTIVVLHPERARGLEFDAVVVVEPASFPENLGRAGSLYTSLTRATKALTVLHSAALPRGLRAPRGR